MFLQQLIMVCQNLCLSQFKLPFSFDDCCASICQSGVTTQDSNVQMGQGSYQFAQRSTYLEILVIFLKEHDISFFRWSVRELLFDAYQHQSCAEHPHHSANPCRYIDNKVHQVRWADHCSCQ